MIQTLIDLNTKSAVLHMIMYMAFFNALFTVGVVGLFNLYQGYRRKEMKSEILEKIDKSKSGIIAHIKPEKK